MNDGTPTGRGFVPQSTAHLSEPTIELIADGLLAGEDLRDAEAHLSRCAACEAELEAARSLFGALAQLPRYAPSPAFAELVMAKVQVTPRASPVFAWIRHWAPETRRGWTLLVATVLAPMLPLLGFALWVASSPVLTAPAVIDWSLRQTRSMALSGVEAIGRWSMTLGVTGWIEAALMAARGLPLDALLVALVVLAVAIPLSAWSLVRLVRTPTGNVTYAN